MNLNRQERVPMGDIPTKLDQPLAADEIGAPGTLVLLDVDGREVESHS